MRQEHTIFGLFCGVHATIESDKKLVSVNDLHLVVKQSEKVNEQPCVTELAVNLMHLLIRTHNSLSLLQRTEVLLVSLDNFGFCRQG